MSTLPIVSIVLPSYNHADFVKDAVESVLNQTIKDIELIVIDDGSNDSTPEIVERIYDPRLRLIRLKQNRLRHPRNLGLQLAQGQYIAFQNSDDVWHPKKLEMQIDLLKEREDVVVCFTETDIIDVKGNLASDSWANGIFTRENRPQLNWLRYFFDKGNCLCLTSALVRRTALERIGGFQGSYIQLADFELWIRLAALGEFHIINSILTSFRDTTFNGSFRKNSGNLSSPNPASRNRTVIENASVLENYLNSPIVDMLPKIFPEIRVIEPDTKAIRAAQLAKYAWSLNTIHHSLFADKAISLIMNDEPSRNEVTDALGAEIIQGFVKYRGNTSVRFESEFSEQVAQRDRSIEHLSAQLEDREKTIQTLLAQTTNDQHIIQNLFSQMSEKDRTLQDVSNQLSSIKQTLYEIYHSNSWKVTSPLRSIRDIFDKLKKKNEKRS